MGQKEGGDSQVREEELAVGLNELEGAVLIDAEDYRRMVQEVKTLKTMLLRLKRELTADVSGWNYKLHHDDIIVIYEIILITLLYYIIICREQPHLLHQLRLHLWYEYVMCPFFILSVYLPK